MDRNVRYSFQEDLYAETDMAVPLLLANGGALVPMHYSIAAVVGACPASARAAPTCI